MRPIALFRAGLIVGFALSAAPAAFAYTALYDPNAVNSVSEPQASPVPRETVSYSGPYAPQIAAI